MDAVAKEVAAFKLVVATAGILFLTVCGLDWISIKYPVLLPAWFGRLLPCVPLVVLLVHFLVFHFRWQRPSRSSIAVALLTSFASLLVAFSLTVTVGLWWHIHIGGEY